MNCKTTSGDFEITFAQSLKDITIHQFELLSSLNAEIDIRNSIKEISILTSTDEEKLYQVIDIADFINNTAEEVRNIAVKFKEEIENLIIPEKVFFKNFNKTIKVHKNLSFYPLGARIMAEEIIKEQLELQKISEGDKKAFKMSNIKATMELLASFFYCGVTSLPYSEIQVLLFIAEIRTLSAYDSLAISKYFFLNYPHFLKLNLSFWSRVRMETDRLLATRKLKYSGGWRR